MTEKPKNPRLRVLELPTVHVGDIMTTPHLLVFDRVTEELGESIASIRKYVSSWGPMAVAGVLALEDEIDLGEDL